MNAYFQLIAQENITAIRLVPPTDGGLKINISEMTEYLQMKKIEISDIKALYQIAAAYDKEVVFPISTKPCLPQQETFSLKLLNDNMEAVVRFYPPSSNGAAYANAGEIINDLKFQKVVYGYDQDAISGFLAKRRYCEDIVIARGKDPVHGTDASIEYFFNTELNSKPKRNEDGSVDFFNLNTINHCKEGDLLARLTKEVMGQNGISVCNEIVKSRTIKKLILKYGNNIAISEDGCEIYSQINGHVMLTGDKVFVSDVYEVENVGTATGNIVSEGSVTVNGNVQTGFSIKAKGNVLVKGVVEGADIECGGDIIVTRGMNGMGRGTLCADGNVVLKFAENATIKAGGYVESESIMHSRVEAETYILVEGRKGFIVGGTVRATEKVSCKTLGSPMGADTVIEVGVDPESKRRYQELQKQMMEAQKNMKNIQPILLNLTERIKKGDTFTQEQTKYVQSLAAANQQMTQIIETSQAEMDHLEKAMQNDGQACVCVSEDAYAGTKITIGDASLSLRDSVKYCRFIKDRGDIRITSY